MRRALRVRYRRFHRRNIRVQDDCLFLRFVTCPSQKDSYANAINYEPWGALFSMQMGVTSSNAGWTETRQYDLKRMQPTSLAVGSSLLSLAFYYCPGQATSCTINNGNMASQIISHSAIGSEPALNLTQTYGYDALNRLNSFSEGNGNISQAYGHDRWGNQWVATNTNST
jgi:hypothetical protein